MALSPIQRDICRLLADQRIASGESYVAGGAALNEAMAAPRLSEDVDLFHDSAEALDASWTADRTTLEASGYEVEALRERPSFVEARVHRGAESLLLQWARDSAYRFFPLVRHSELGLTLHPFDLATNKVLALVGRLEVRDWVDVIECDARIQELGLLAWAACAKDPGFGPGAILEQAGRSSHYSADEISSLAFAGEPPDPATLSRRWRDLLERARETVTLLPPEEAGKCVLGAEGELFRGSPAALRTVLAERRVFFHAGSLRGAVPVPLT